ncbi:hypothetical protein XU18_2215 [Perkinsela sp. CCAP 1560/4]|nr:hypothetical protein XU18_2215 [Perkinsela sp. CCAP 1560/4]|eukprot:KNH07038.1 hypothetical protein XU18_2215 [Perkinsela sp. CCAP 1560/4]
MFPTNVRLRVRETGILSFMMHQRGKLIKKNPSLPTSLVTKYLAEQWRLLSTEERQAWELYRNGSIAYPVSKKRGGMPTGLMTFLIVETPRLVGHNAELSQLEICEKIVEKWKSLQKAELAKWRQLDAEMAKKKCLPPRSRSHDQSSNPVVGYVHFYATMLPKLPNAKDASVGQSSKEIRERWESMSLDEQKEWGCGMLEGARPKKALNGFFAFMQAQRAQAVRRGQPTQRGQMLAKAWRALSAEERARFNMVRQPRYALVACPAAPVKSMRRMRKELFFLDNYLKDLWKKLRAVGDTPSDRHKFELFVRLKMQNHKYSAAEFRRHCAGAAHAYKRGFRRALGEIMERLHRSIPRIHNRKGETIAVENTKASMKEFYIAEEYFRLRRKGMGNQPKRFQAAIRKYETMTLTNVEKIIRIHQLVAKQFEKVSSEQPISAL